MNKINSRLIVLVFFVVIILLLVTLSYNKFEKYQINTSIINLDNCEKDDDCVITEHKAFDCCNTCFVDSINKKADIERKKWEKNNCGSKEFRSCLYAECSVISIDYDALCINKTCNMTINLLFYFVNH